MIFFDHLRHLLIYKSRLIKSNSIFYFIFILFFTLGDGIWTAPSFWVAGRFAKIPVNNFGLVISAKHPFRSKLQFQRIGDRWLWPPGFPYNWWHHTSPSTGTWVRWIWRFCRPKLYEHCQKRSGLWLRGSEASEGKNLFWKIINIIDGQLWEAILSHPHLRGIVYSYKM